MHLDIFGFEYTPSKNCKEYRKFKNFFSEICLKVNPDIFKMFSYSPVWL